MWQVMTQASGGPEFLDFPSYTCTYDQYRRTLYVTWFVAGPWKVYNRPRNESVVRDVMNNNKRMEWNPDKVFRLVN